MNWVSDFRADVSANEASPMRKKWWIFLFMRLERACPWRLGRRALALPKKLLLMGTGCEFRAESFSGGGCRMPHLNGVVINPEARIGADVTIFHQVTLGIAGVPDRPGAPRVGDCVTIGAGAKLLGPITVGDGALVGANAVVTKDVPAGCTVVGANKISGGQR